MRFLLAVVGLLLVAVDPSKGEAHKNKCNSGMKGDFGYETCATFCKASLAERHCKYGVPTARARAIFFSYGAMNLG